MDTNHPCQDKGAGIVNSFIRVWPNTSRGESGFTACYYAYNIALPNTQVNGATFFEAVGACIAQAFIEAPELWPLHIAGIYVPTKSGGWIAEYA